jgi:alpha-1,2-mannosyltransferase
MPKQQPYSRKLSVLSSGSWLTAERAKLYPLAFLVTNALVFLGFVLAGHGNLDALGKPIGTDFASFWTASRFVLAGNAAGAYDPYQHHAAQILLFGKKDVDFYAWFYPPTALLIVAPLGLLPYGISLLSWLAVTTAAYVATIWKFIPRADALIPILGFPAVITNVGHGQNAFFSTAIVGIGLFISDRRPIAAGALLGCLCYKPQLAPMLAIVVLARRDWKMALGAALSIAAQALTATLLFGPEIWIRFESSLPLAKASLEQGIIGFGKMQSAFSAIRLLGGGNSLAYCVQAAVAVAAAILLWRIWRTEASLLLRTGATGAAMLLGTPFILDYDFVLLALPIAALTSEGLRTGFKPYEKSVLAAAWVLPWVARLAATHANIPLSPEIVLLLLVLIWKRASADNAACVVPGPETGGVAPLSQRGLLCSIFVL